MISREKKVIFFHNPKTAGVSVLKFLAKQGFWPADVLNLSKEESIEYGFGIDSNTSGYRQHCTPSQHLKYKYITIEEYNTFFKFTFIRNPWGRTVSAWMYEGRKKTFEEHVKYHCSIKLGEHRFHYLPQYPYTIGMDGKLIDFIGRYESFEEDLYKICDILKIKKAKIPYVNISRGERKPYQEYYTNELRDAIGEHFEIDIKLFGYKFE